MQTIHTPTIQSIHTPSIHSIHKHTHYLYRAPSEQQPGLHARHPTQLPAFSFSLPARAAAPVRATESLCPLSPLGGQTMELLVLSPSGQLDVYQVRVVFA